MQPDITRSAVELTTALRERQITASELVEQAIHRSEIVSGTVNPIAVNLYDRARESAIVADKKLDAGTGGALCGLPVTIKDSQWLAGVPCANGSHSLQDFVPERSSAAVANLERAGAVIFAKTTCPELSLFGITDSALYGRTSNPWNLERTPGGSSGGAGAAVATGLGPMSLGGDGGGSIRIPAAFCGIVGFKPTHGLVNRKPCFPSWDDLVAYGPMTRTVGDAKLMLSSLVPPRKRGRLTPRAPEDLSAERLKIIVSEDLGFVPVDADVRERFQNLLNLLSDAGAELIYANPGLSSSARVWAITATRDAWKHHDEEAAAQGSIGEIAQNFIEFGSLFTDAEFKDAQKHRREISRAYKRLFKETGANLMLTPTLGCEAFPHDRIHPEQIEQTFIEPPWIDWAGFLYDANLAGLPACALPMGVGNEGLPVSAQVMGAKGADAEVLDAAEIIESLLGWYHPHAV